MQKFQDYVRSLSSQSLMEYCFFISKKLDNAVNLYQVLHYYDIDVSSKSDEEQIECKLPTHFGIDRNKSARYYSHSNSGVARVYCFKCNSTLSSFWYFYKMEKQYDLGPSEILLKFIKQFKVEISDDFYSFNQSQEDNFSNIPISQEIQYYRNLKFHNLNSFKKELSDYILQKF